MSADDDTFDIDIYGDEEQRQPEPPPKLEPEDDLYYEAPVNEANGEDYNYDDIFNDTATNSRDQPDQAVPGAEHTNINSEPKDITPTQPQQGTKRKAPSDEEESDDKPTALSTSSLSQTYDLPLDPSATPGLKLTDLNWWTTEEDLRAYASRASVEQDLYDLTFAEHKINGKARGEAYLEFSSAQAAQATKREIEKDNQEGSNGTAGPRKAVAGVQFCAVGNPYKTAPGAGVGAKREGAYNQPPTSGRGGYNSNYSSQRGNYGGGRGSYGQSQNRGGGGYSNGGGMYNNRQNQQPQQQNGWAMNGGMNGGMANFGGGGYAGNPMMNMMGNFNNMARGGMMPNMMGRGGAFGGGMGTVGMGMNAMGGMGMMGRGGWGGGGFQGGMQQNYNNAGGGFQAGFQSGGSMSPQPQQQQQGNKRAKMG